MCSCVNLFSTIVSFRYFASEQHKTGKPIPGDHLMDKIPLELDMEKSLGDPFVLHDWIDKHREEIEKKGKKMMFEGDQQFQVVNLVQIHS